MSTALYVNGIIGISGEMERGRIAGTSGANVAEIAGVENLNGASVGLGTFLFSGTVATLADVLTSPPYTFEVRKVTAQTSVSFDASTAVRAGPTPFWVKDGAIINEPVVNLSASNTALLVAGTNTGTIRTITVTNRTVTVT